MECSLVFDANSYHRFSNCHEMESDFMRFLTHGKATASSTPAPKGESFLVKEIQKVRETIKSSLDNTGPGTTRIDHLENLVKQLFARVGDLETQIQRLSRLNTEAKASSSAAAAKICAAAASAPQKIEDNDDSDLFGSDNEGAEEAAKQLASRNAAAKAAKKEKPVAKSMIILDVKPWDDETDMAAMEKAVRAISTDGLLWGTSKLVPLVHGIKKLQITTVVEDDKVGTDFLEESICALEDYVQSVDIAAFNKL